MDALPEFELIRPRTLAEVLSARAAHPQSRLIGGGTDLMVNIRRGIEAPRMLIDLTGVAELRAITADEHQIEVGAGVKLAELAAHPEVARHYPVVAQAAGFIAGPTHRNMGTVGGNLCLDTRCIYYNQSEWWRHANGYCLKHRGDVCHVAPQGQRCHAAYTGDLAPALLALDAEVEIVGSAGCRRVPLRGFITGPRATALAADELVVAIQVPRPGHDARSAFLKLGARRYLVISIAMAAATLEIAEGRVAAARIAVGACSPVAERLPALESALLGAPFDARLAEQVDQAQLAPLSPIDDVRGSADYRSDAIITLLRRLLVSLAP